MATKHISAKDLATYLSGQLNGPKFHEVDHHLRNCLRCRNRATKTPREDCLRFLDRRLQADVEEALASIDPIGHPGALGCIAGMYRIDELIGAGGMGIVFRGVDLNLGERPVAIKFLRPSIATNPEDNKDIYQRFIHEASLAVKVTHDNVIDIFTYSTVRSSDSGVLLPYFAMEYAADGSLDRLLSNKGGDIFHTLALARQIASGLSALHAVNVIHRDLKPANIVLNQQVPKITDFGIARLIDRTTFTDASQLLGSRPYMAPEQLAGQPASDKSDMFSLGTLLFQMTMRRLPEPGERTIPRKEQLFTLEKLISMLRDPEPRLRPSAEESVQILAKAEAETRALRQPSAQTLMPVDPGSLTERVSGMYTGGVSFFINKNFGRLQLIPESMGIRFHYIPIIDDEEEPSTGGFLDMLLPLDGVGGLLATSRAFLYGAQSLDENVILQGGDDESDSDILIKLFRDKPLGPNETLTGAEACWLKIVTGKTDQERRLFKLGPRDLLCLQEALSMTAQLSVLELTHRPQRYWYDIPRRRPLCNKCWGTRRNVIEHTTGDISLALCAPCLRASLTTAVEEIDSFDRTCVSCEQTMLTPLAFSMDQGLCSPCLYAHLDDLVASNQAWWLSQRHSLELMEAFASVRTPDVWDPTVRTWWDLLTRQERNYDLPINETLLLMISAFIDVPSAHDSLREILGAAFQQEGKSWDVLCKWYGDRSVEALPHNEQPLDTEG